MPKPLLIGIAGKKGSGKDTAALRLVDKYGFRKISWADTLKEACKPIFGFTDEQLWGKYKEKIDPNWGMTPREVLQKVGTDCLRNYFDQEIWIKSSMIRIKKMWEVNPNQGIVIPDVRFLNEANFIKAEGGFLWQVDRKIEANEFSSHESETALDSYTSYDGILINDKDITKLYKEVDANYQKILNSEKEPTKNVFNKR